MKFFRKKGDSETSIRSVWSNDHEVCFGVVGTVGDLLKTGILEYCDVSPEAWAFLPSLGIMHKARFADTKQGAVEELPE